MPLTELIEQVGCVVPYFSPLHYVRVVFSRICLITGDGRVPILWCLEKLSHDVIGKGPFSPYQPPHPLEGPSQNTHLGMTPPPPSFQHHRVCWHRGTGAVCFLPESCPVLFLVTPSQRAERLICSSLCLCSGMHNWFVGYGHLLNQTKCHQISKFPKPKSVLNYSDQFWFLNPGPPPPPPSKKEIIPDLAWYKFRLKFLGFFFHFFLFKSF